MFVGMGANGAASGYNLTDSLRFRSSATAYLDRTQSSGNQQKWTFSAWVKRGAIGTYSVLMAAHKSGVTELTEIYFHSDDKLYVALASGTQAWYRNTNRVCRDTSAWYHVVGSVDTTNDSIRVWVNNEESTASIAGAGSFTNFNTHFNSSTASCSIGRRPVLNSWHFDGYITDINFVDGQQLTASDFGEYDEDTGIWKPKKYSGSYGTNGFYSKNGRGTDQSGNGNNFTENNFNTTTSSATTYDIMSDVPTLTDEDTSNYPTWNPLFRPYSSTYGYNNLNGVITEGNLKVAPDASNNSAASVTMGFTSGKYYAEFTAGGSATSYYPMIGIVYDNTNTNLYDGGTCYQAPNGYKRINGTASAYGSSWTGGDVIGVAVDADANNITFYKNNVSQGSIAFTPVDEIRFAWWCANAFNAQMYANFGQRPFAYTPPTGYKKLNTYNLPDSSITDGSQYFNTVLYSGTGSSHTIDTGMYNDFTWLKMRSGSSSHYLWNAIRGFSNTKALDSRTTAAEGHNSSYYTVSRKTGNQGFIINDVSPGNEVNSSGNTYVAWNWRANDGSSGVTNNDGSVTSTVSANTTAGFSIATFAASGTFSIGHGLGVQPDVLILKSYSTADGWVCWFRNPDGVPTRNARYLHSTTGTATSGSNWLTTANASIYQFVTGQFFSAGNFVAFSWAEVEGYSKFGKYTGNGTTPAGPFVYTGFRPSFIIVKRTDAAYGWVMFDNKRDTYNYERTYILANSNGAEATQVEGSGSWTFDFFANGFRPTGGSAANAINASGGTYIYMAFAENPFKNSLAR